MSSLMMLIYCMWPYSSY